mgnify:CR=1 FL=1
MARRADRWQLRPREAVLSREEDGLRVRRSREHVLLPRRDDGHVERGEQARELSADFVSAVAGRQLEDDAMVNVRMDGGATAIMPCFSYATATRAAPDNTRERTPARALYQTGTAPCLMRHFFFGCLYSG